MGRSGGVANVRGEVAFVAQQVLGDVDVDENDDRVGGGRGLRGRDSDGGDCDQSVGQSVFVLQHALCPPSAPKLFTWLIFFPQAWIRNQTLKENIMFDKPFSDKLYRKVLKSTCAIMKIRQPALEPDLAE